jgi:iron complex outermembrane receptor protein
MAYIGHREVTQYQSIPSSAQKNPRHAGGVIDFERDFYGADLRWTGKDFCRIHGSVQAWLMMR